MDHQRDFDQSLIEVNEKPVPRPRYCRTHLLTVYTFRFMCSIYCIYFNYVNHVYRSSLNSLMSNATDSELNSVSSEEVNVAQEDEQLPPRPGTVPATYIILI